MTEGKHWAYGTVSFYHERKGYGFIESPHFNEDVFFHLDSLDGINYIEKGQQIQFEATFYDKGPRVTKIGDGLPCDECESEMMYHDKRGKWFCPFCES